MMNTENNFCIILAGGIGRRLWPVSRKDMPKQFIDFFGTGRTLLQQTYDRFVRILPPSHIMVSTHIEYKQLVREQLPDIPESNILAEPVRLSTAPSAAWASCYIGSLCPDACIVATPSDQHIIGEDHFTEQICRGFEFVAEHSEFLSIGVKATTPNSAYGYIQMGESVPGTRLHRVKSFTEKPAPDYARLFVESGEFLWNTGLFLWHNKTMQKLVNSSMGGAESGAFPADCEQTTEENLEMVRRVYPSSMHRSLDLVILDKCENLYVKEADFGWADVGSWPEMHAVSGKDADGNVLLGTDKAMLSGCHDTIVVLPKGMGAVVRGLDGYLVACKDNMLLVCPNEDPALARRLANEVQMKMGEQYT